VAASRLRRRKLAGVSAALYMGVLLAFFLPFVSASCSEPRVESEPLTGWDLLTGKEATIHEGDGFENTAAQAKAVQDVRDLIEDVRRATRFLAVVTVLALVLALNVAVFGRNGLDVAALLLGGLLWALAHGVVSWSGQTELFGVEVHFHSGYALALALGGGALATDVWLTGELRRRPRKRPGVMISAVAILAGVMVISGLIMLAARMAD
jgi:hypothetical protein